MVPTPLIGIVVITLPRRTNFKEGSGEYVTHKALLSDMCWVVPLSGIILRDVDRRGEHGVDLITQVTTLVRGDRLE